MRLWVLLQSLVKVFVCGSRQLTGAVQITVHLWYVAERPLPYSSGVFSRGLPFLYCLWMEGWITAWFLASMLFCNSAEWEEKEEGRGRRRRILSGTLHCRSPCSVLLAREKGFLEVIAACLTVTSVLLCTRDWPQGRAARENRGHKKQHGIPTSPLPQYPAHRVHFAWSCGQKDRILLESLQPAPTSQIPDVAYPQREARR